jgi:hypothetical protein
MLTLEVSYIAMANGIKMPVMIVVGLTVDILLIVTGNYLS